MDIAVIGAGIGGLASAILLARQGHRLTVYEQAKEPRPVGAGFLLQPPGQVVLRELGIWERVRDGAMPISGLRAKTTAGRQLLNLNYSDLIGNKRCGWGLERRNIFDALYEQALKTDGISFEWGSPVLNCINETDPDSVSIQTSSQEHHHDLCVLSAGTGSELANTLFPGRIKNAYSWGCLWASIKLPSHISPQLLQQRCQGTSKMMGILPTAKSKGANYAALYWSMTGQNMQTLSEENFESIKQEMASFWPDLSDSIRVLEYSDFAIGTYNDVWTPNPYNNRVVAIGDVSHGTSPQLGQGCTMALLDALSLARSLPRGLVSKESDLNSTLKEWWCSRKNQLMFVRHMSRFLTPFYQSNDRKYSIFRDHIMAPMGRMPGLYAFQLRTLASEIFLDKRSYLISSL